MFGTAAKRRFFLIFLPAIIALMLPLLACGGGSGTAIPACQNLTDGDACNECCTGEGYIGHMFNSFSTPPCKCL